MAPGEQPVAHLGVLGLDKGSFTANDVSARLSNVNVAHRGLPRTRQGANGALRAAGCSRAPRASTAGRALPHAVRSRDPARRVQPPADVTHCGADQRQRAQRLSRGPPAGVTLAAGRRTEGIHTTTQSGRVADTDRCPIIFGCASRISRQRLTQAWRAMVTWCRTRSTISRTAPHLISVRGRASFTRRSSAWKNAACRR